MKDDKRTTVRLTSLLIFVFFFSGFASLIYQVVWQRVLTFYYGVGAISVTLIVSVFMVGLGIGALLGGFLAERVKNRIVFYFAVELLIGCFGLISIPFLDFLGRYTAGSSYVMSFVYMFLFLCIPTFLMGVTLPLLTKIFNDVIQNFLRTVSLLYFINTIGAAVGALFASYVFISFGGLNIASYIAVGINFILAVLIFVARYLQTGQERSEYTPCVTEASDSSLGSAAYFFVFFTGFLAIGYEIVWFRLIGVLVKDSPYAFSSILSVYLFGIAVGSFGVNKYLQRQAGFKRRDIFFLLQFLIGAFVMGTIISYYYLTMYTPLGTFTRISFGSFVQHPSAGLPSLLPIKDFLKGVYCNVDVFFWPMIFVFIPTVLMGATFPVVSTLALARSDREGITVGAVYFFNIVGNVLGGVVSGFFLLPYLGTELTLLLFSSAGICFGLFVKDFSRRRLLVFKTLCFILIVGSVFVFPKAGYLYRVMHSFDGKGFETYLEEGVDGLIVTFRRDGEIKNYINGLIHGGRPNFRFYFETIEALSYAPRAANVLVIGFGSGSVVEVALRSRDTRKVTVVELSGALMSNLKKISLFREMLANPKLELVIDDGRRYLLRTKESFDLILMDPVKSTTSYSNNLYSRQFFELAKQHLTDEGVLMLWTDEFRVLPRTLTYGFDYVRMYNFFLLGSSKPFEKDFTRDAELMDTFSVAERANILKAGQYLGDQALIKRITIGYPINEDWKPVCEYYLGLRVREKVFLRGEN